MPRASLCAVLVASLLSTPSLPALAEPSGGKALAAAEPATVWYGWQTLLSDAAAVGLLFSGAGRSSTTAWATFGVYAAGGPVVHLANGQAGAAGRSLALRLGLPMGGALLFAGGAKLVADDGCPSGGCGSSGPSTAVSMGLIGAFFGIVAAITVDASLASKPAAPRETSLRLSPSFAVTQDRAVLGAAGSF